MAAQAGDDLQPLLDRGAEMRRAADRIALVEVIGLHPALQKTMHQRHHDLRVVVDAFEQHGLRAQRDARIGQPRSRFGHLFGQLCGMGDMDAHPQRMIFAQDLDQILGDALRQHHGDFRADAQELDVLDRPQPAEQPVELVVAQRQRIAAGQQDVAHFAMAFEIFERFFPLTGRELIFAARIAHHAGAGAIAAIGRAGARGEEQHPIGIAVDETGNHRVVVLVEGIVRFAGASDIFLAGHDVGAPQRFVRIVKAHQAGVIRGDSDGQRAFVAPDCGAFVVRQREYPGKLVEGADAGTHLPAPVVPLHGRGAGVEVPIESAGFGIDGKAQRSP